MSKSSPISSTPLWDSNDPVARGNVHLIAGDGLNGRGAGEFAEGGQHDLVTLNPEAGQTDALIRTPR